MFKYEFDLNVMICEWVVRVDEACLGEVVSWAVLVMEVLGMGVYT